MNLTEYSYNTMKIDLTITEQNKVRKKEQGYNGIEKSEIIELNEIEENENRTEWKNRMRSYIRSGFQFRLYNVYNKIAMGFYIFSFFPSLLDLQYIGIYLDDEIRLQTAICCWQFLSLCDVDQYA